MGGMDTIRCAEGGAYKMWGSLPVQVDAVFIRECKHGIAAYVNNGGRGLAGADSADHWHATAMGECRVDGGGIRISRIE